MITEIKLLEEVIHKYGRFLQNSQIQEILNLYTAQAEIIPDGMMTVRGIDEIEEFYNTTFETIQIIGELHLVETILHNNLAIIRCEETAQIKLKQEKITENAYFRELFILKKVKDSWKIHKYMFSKIPQH